MQTPQQLAMMGLIFTFLYFAITVALVYVIAKLYYDRSGKITGAGIFCITLMLQFPILILFIFILNSVGAGSQVGVILLNMGSVVAISFLGWCCLTGKKSTYQNSDDLLVFTKPVRRKEGKMSAPVEYKSDEVFRDILHDKARNLAEEGNLEGAEEIYRRLIKNFPDYRPAYAEFAVLLSNQGRQEEAQRLLQQLGDDSEESVDTDFG
jgi:tetratricopeptide (TPR) repeat protein